MISRIKKVFHLFFTKTDLFFKMALFDLLFVISVFFANTLFLLLLPQNPASLLQIVSSFKFVIIFAVFIGIIYLSFIVFIYSFFKYLNIDLLENLNRQNSFSFRYFWKFYILNLFIFGIILSLFAFLNILLFFIVNATFASVFSIITFFPFAFFSISFIVLSHVLFLKEKSYKKIIQKSISQIFKLNNISLYFVAIVFFLFFVLFYYATAFFFGIIHLENATPLFVNIFAGMTFFVFYFIFTFCRTYSFIEG